MTQQFTILIFTTLLTSSTLNAQIEQVSVGASYSQQAYYNLSTGEVTQVPNDAWDIAFSNAGLQDAGVFINESASLMSNPLKLFVAEETNWETPATDMSGFVDSEVIYNPEESWTEGAFNSIKDPDSPLDYGWGAYNPTTHRIEGNQIFVIQKRDDSFIKFQVMQLVGGEYTFRYADLDGSNEVTSVVSKNEAGESPLIYFSFETGDEVDMPTDYDLVFQRYTTPLDDGSGTFIEYTVTGVLSAPHTEAVIADGVDPINVMESDYSDQYSMSPTVIGHDWKFFDFASGWLIDEDRAYFVKTKNDKTFKLVFFDFEGSSTGITTLEKTEVETVSTTDISLSDLDILVYPNPTSDFINIEGVKESFDAYLYNAFGQLVLSNEINSASTQINLNEVNSGMYTLVLSNQNYFANHTILVNK